MNQKSTISFWLIRSCTVSTWLQSLYKQDLAELQGKSHGDLLLQRRWTITRIQWSEATLRNCLIDCNLMFDVCGCSTGGKEQGNKRRMPLSYRQLNSNGRFSRSAREALGQGNGRENGGQMVKMMWDSHAELQNHNLTCPNHSRAQTWNHWFLASQKLSRFEREALADQLERSDERKNYHHFSRWTSSATFFTWYKSAGSPKASESFTKMSLTHATLWSRQSSPSNVWEKIRDFVPICRKPLVRIDREQSPTQQRNHTYVISVCLYIL